MKNANDSIRLEPSKKQPAPTQPGKEHRADPGSQTHRANQDDLGVDPDHRTEGTRKEKRGTFR